MGLFESGVAIALATGVTCYLIGWFIGGIARVTTLQKKYLKGIEDVLVAIDECSGNHAVFKAKVERLIGHDKTRGLTYD